KKHLIFFSYYPLSSNLFTVKHGIKKYIFIQPIELFLLPSMNDSIITIIQNKFLHCVNFSLLARNYSSLFNYNSQLIPVECTGISERFEYNTLNSSFVQKL